MGVLVLPRLLPGAGVGAAAFAAVFFATAAVIDTIAYFSRRGATEQRIGNSRKPSDALKNNLGAPYLLMKSGAYMMRLPERVSASMK